MSTTWSTAHPFAGLIGSLPNVEESPGKQFCHLTGLHALLSYTNFCNKQIHKKLDKYWHSQNVKGKPHAVQEKIN